jgi:glutathione S-transferase
MPASICWGVEASPFLLKLEAMLRFQDLPYRRLPRDGSLLVNLRTSIQLQTAIRSQRIERYPRMDRALDEYPSVPFFSMDGRHFQYDSSAIGHWLDDRPERTRPPLFPPEAALGFVAQLIDEAFDEYGLYMVHHMRWVGSATDTNMPANTAAEMSRLFTPLASPLLRKQLPRRQVRRCPYLFSVAPSGYSAAVEPKRVPPSRAGFPPTHDLLYQSWCSYLAAMESLLASQEWLLGDRFSIADASAYGQLSMNLVDASAERQLTERAPRTRQWLESIRRGVPQDNSGRLYLSDALGPLLDIIMQTFAPLMAQNEQAFKQATSVGETHFNEAAFDQHRALYDGEFLGHPFRSVAKTFQVRVWQELRQNWKQLPLAEQTALQEMLPNHHLLNAD